MKKYKTLFEDTTMRYNKWVQGVAQRDMSTTPMRLSDVKKPGTKEPNTTPPILDGTSQILGCIVLNVGNLQQKLMVALESTLAEKKETKKILEDNKYRVRWIQREINKIIKDIKKIA